MRASVLHSQSMAVVRASVLHVQAMAGRSRINARLEVMAVLSASLDINQ